MYLITHINKYNIIFLNPYYEKNKYPIPKHLEFFDS